MIDLKQAIALLIFILSLQAIALSGDRFKVCDRVSANNHTLGSCDRTYDDRFKTGDRIPQVG